MSVHVVTTQAEYDEARPQAGDTVYLDSDAQFGITGSTQPCLVVREEYEPTIDTRGSSSPTIYTRDSSSPTIDTWDSSSPTIYTWDSSSPTIEDHRVTAEPEPVDRLSELVGKMQALLEEYAA
jgi:hypothetical protein